MFLSKLLRGRVKVTTITIRRGRVTQREFKGICAFLLIRLGRLRKIRLLNRLKHRRLASETSSRGRRTIRLCVSLSSVFRRRVRSLAL